MSGMIPLGVLTSLYGQDAAELVYVGSVVKFGTPGLTFEFLDVPIGDPTPDRTVLIVAVSTNGGGTRYITNIASAGVTFIKDIDTGTASTGGLIIRSSDFSGLTANFTMTISAYGAAHSISLSVYTFDGPLAIMDAEWASTITRPLPDLVDASISLDTPNEGFVLGALGARGSVGTSTSLDVDYAMGVSAIVGRQEPVDPTTSVNVVGLNTSGSTGRLFAAAYAPWPDGALFVDDFAGTSRPLTNDYEAAFGGVKVAVATAANGVVAFQSTDGSEFYMRQVNHADVDVSLVIDGLSSIRRAWAIGARISSGYAMNTVGLSGIPNSGYTFEVNNDSPNNNGIYRNGVKVASSSPEVARITQDAKYKMRLRAQGGLVQGKCWLLAEPEPEAWTFEYMDPVPLPAGGVGFGNRNSGNRPTTARAPFMALAI